MKLRVKLVHSPISCDRQQKKIVRGLGLGKLYSERELLDTPAIRGMITKIPHLVKIMEETGERKRYKRTRRKSVSVEAETMGVGGVKEDETQ